MEHWLRLHSPLGYYPMKSIRCNDARLYIEKDVIFSIVQVQPQENHGITLEHLSELQFLSLEEIRFFAAIILSLCPDDGIVFTYPLPTTITLQQQDSDEIQLLKIAADHANAIVENDQRSNYEYVMPPIAGGPDYRFRTDNIDTQLLEKLISSIDLNNHLLMRGLGSMIQAQMLYQRREFFEPAIAMLFIAMEVSFQLILKRLRDYGVTNPSSSDAGKYIGDTFDPHFASHYDGYLREWYELRVKSLHPSSRYGVFAYPPLLIDDVFFLRHALVRIFTHLVADHIWPAE